MTTKTIAFRYEEIQHLLVEHRVHTADWNMASPEQTKVMEGHELLRREAQDAGKAAEEAIGFPNYAEHPDWPEDYEVARLRMEEIQRDRKALNDFRVLVNGLSRPGSLSQVTEGLKLGGPASSALQAFTWNVPIIEQPGEMGGLERSTASYNRNGGRVKRVREQMYKAWRDACEEARTKASDEVMQTPTAQGITLEFNRVVGELKTTKLNLDAHYRQVITLALDDYTKSVAGTSSQNESG